jgi:tetratricopeptide (TPR) repeat protein
VTEDRDRAGGRPPDRAAGPSRGGRGRGSGAGRPGRSGGPPQGGSSSRGRPDRSPSAGGATDRPRPVRNEPPLPDDVNGSELDRSIRAELASLASVNAETVARHLVMAGRLLDDDPETAYLHAAAAAKRAGRVGAVREAAGLTAYRSGRYAEALAELRAARRISGDHSSLPVMADCERGLGRPERALEIAASPEVKRLEASARVEMDIVASGARRDMGQHDAAVLALQGPALEPHQRKPWSARLFYAYADALEAAGRVAEATTWFGHAAEADTQVETDADVRLAALSGVTFLEGDDED